MWWRENSPVATIVVAQVENRFYLPGDRWGCPVGEDYLAESLKGNNFLKRLVKSQGIKGHFLMVTCGGRLDSQVWYRHEVYLNPEGLDKY